jgi:hypothetical protein
MQFGLKCFLFTLSFSSAICFLSRIFLNLRNSLCERHLRLPIWLWGAARVKALRVGSASTRRSRCVWALRSLLLGCFAFEFWVFFEMYPLFRLRFWYAPIEKLMGLCEINEFVVGLGLILTVGLDEMTTRL